MPIDLNTLDPQFLGKVQQLLDACTNAGYQMVPTQGIRSPFDEGKLWRQSRTADEVQQEIDSLNNQGFDFLAGCIADGGPQNGPHVTNAIPGLSWHQWGEALDCVWIVDGAENWSETALVNGKNGYQVYADLAETFGLTAGGHWINFKDWPHVQLSSRPSPEGTYTLQEINDTMRQRFGA